MATIITDWSDDTLNSTPGENNRLNGYGRENLALTQFDVLIGNNSKIYQDTFVLGGAWGVSYHDNVGWGKDGYALIKNWNPEVDRIEVYLSSEVHPSAYTLEKSKSIVGSRALDTQIFSTDAEGSRSNCNSSRHHRLQSQPRCH